MQLIQKQNQKKSVDKVKAFAKDAGLSKCFFYENKSVNMSDGNSQDYFRAESHRKRVVKQKNATQIQNVVVEITYDG